MMAAMFIPGTSTALYPAKEIAEMAKNASIALEARQSQLIGEAVKACRDEWCVHTIPLLGWIWRKHKMYENTEQILECAPEVHFARQTMQMELRFCKAMQLLTEKLLAKDPDAVMVISLNDFSLLQQEM